MSKSLEVLKGYFGALKTKKSPKNFIQKSYNANKLVDKEILAKHADLVKGKNVEIDMISEVVDKTPDKRILVTFNLNGKPYKACLVKETAPLGNPETVLNWHDENGELGLNPYSVKEVV